MFEYFYDGKRSNSHDTIKFNTCGFNQFYMTIRDRLFGKYISRYAHIFILSYLRLIFHYLPQEVFTLTKITLARLIFTLFKAKTTKSTYPPASEKFHPHVY